MEAETEKKKGKKRKSYTIKEKIEWIEVTKPGMSQVCVVQKFGIMPPTLHVTDAKKEETLATAGASKKTERLPWTGQGARKPTVQVVP